MYYVLHCCFQSLSRLAGSANLSWSISVSWASSCASASLSWVFITGGCSGSGVQWMGVVLYNELVDNIIQITTPCFHCTPL